ncbi:MAG: uroporphyrinogen-III synthase [Elusimicrobia bacterium]|nr:uroporphyrinogen-III synthase [Elusimicrobiota bacterium]
MGSIGKKPLRGKSIVVTRAHSQSSGFVSRLRKLGARVILCPTIRIVPPSSVRPLDKAIHDLDRYDWLIFTSVNGVEKFMQRFRIKNSKGRIPSHLKTCAIGPITAKKMREWGAPVSRIAREYVAESVLDEIKEVSGKKILIPRAREARDVLPEGLRRRGAEVDVVEAYRTKSDRSGFSRFRENLSRGQIDCVTFTSSSTVRNFFSLLSLQEKRRLLKSDLICAASIGPITTATLSEFGWPPRIVAQKSTTEHLLNALVRFYDHSVR